MPPSLSHKVRTLRRLARLLMVVYGLAWVVGSVVAAAVLLGLADYLVRSEDRGVRIICSLAIAVVAGWTIVRFLLPALSRRLTDVEIAQRIERRYPMLRDRLSSAVQFSRQAEQDITAGSATLRRTVIAQAAAEIEPLNLWEVLRYRHTARMAAAASAIVAAMWLVSLSDPASALLAAKRLAIPWSGQTWPRVHELAFVDPPRRIAAGDDLQVMLVDRKGKLPRVVHIYYWHEGQDESEVQPQQMTFSGGKMVHELKRVTQPLKYRAAGGDDDSMPWISLDVVEPPRPSSLHGKLFPPAYTGWPVETTEGNIRALQGTRAEIVGSTNKPLQSARLRIDIEGAETYLDARLTDNGLRFAFPARDQQPWVIGKSGSYALELVDQQGLANGADVRWEIRAVTDRPPTVSLETPAANRFVTPDAIVPLQATVKDDLAIHTIQLRYHLTGQVKQSRVDCPICSKTAGGQRPPGDAPGGPPSTDAQAARRSLAAGYCTTCQSYLGEQIEIYRGPDQVQPVKSGGFTSGARRGESRTVESRWDLRNLDGLQPGTVVLLHVAAADYKPQKDRSASVQLTIVTPGELKDRFATRQAYILGQLAEVLKILRRSRMQTRVVQIQLQETSRLAKQDMDRLRSAQLHQRQIQRLLSEERDGVEALIVSLLTDLENNRVDSPDTTRRMTEILAQIRQINCDDLPWIERKLTSTLKAARAIFLHADSPASENETDAQVAGPLDEAAQRQDEVIGRLERLLGRFSQWDNYRRLAREIRTLRREQEALAQRTSQMRPKTLGKDAKDLNSQERAELKKLVQRQLELARQLGNIQSRMAKMRDQLSGDEPLAAQTLSDALNVANRRAIGGQMRQSGRHIEKNQIGQAARLQQESLDSLQEMLDVLANRREHELGRLRKKLQDAAGKLAELQRRQTGLRKKLQEAGKIKQEGQRQRELMRLSKQKQRLQKELQQMARRLQAERASGSIAKAAGRMGQCSGSCQAGNQQQALEEARQAERDLQQARRQLAEAIKQAEQDLAQEQLARLGQVLQGLRQRQQALLDQTVRLDKLHAEQGRLTRGQMSSLGDLARQQAGLGSEVEDFAEKIVQAEVFYLGLTEAAQPMRRAARRLARRDNSAPTRAAQSDALLRLGQLLTALQQDQGQEGNKSASGGNGAGQGGGAPPRDSIASLAELKLLKLMQETINRRTRQLQDSQVRGGQLTTGQQSQMEQLAQQQGRLADLIFRLTQPQEEPGQDEPNELPEHPPEESLEDPLDKALDELLSGGK